MVSSIKTEERESEINLYICGQLIFNNGANNLQWKKDSPSRKWDWETWTPICNRIHWTRPSPYIEINSEWIRHFIRPGTMAFQEENIAGKLLDVSPGNDFDCKCRQSTTGTAQLQSRTAEGTVTWKAACWVEDNVCKPHIQYRVSTQNIQGTYRTAKQNKKYPKKPVSPEAKDLNRRFQWRHTNGQQVYEKRISITNHQTNANENHYESSPDSGCLGCQRDERWRMPAQTWREGNLVHSCWDCGAGTSQCGKQCRGSSRKTELLHGQQSLRIWPGGNGTTRSHCCVAPWLTTKPWDNLNVQWGTSRQNHVCMCMYI